MKIGIICNWKGLKEENYLYTLDELSKLDFELFQKCIRCPYTWHESAKLECPNKTWAGMLLRTNEEICSFLNGCYNNDRSSDIDGDWYWINIAKNGLYDETSDTMYKEIKRLNIHSDYCSDK